MLSWKPCINEFRAGEMDGVDERSARIVTGDARRVMAPTSAPLLRLPLLRTLPHLALKQVPLTEANSMSSVSFY